jgi:hypothetical protein
MSDNAQNVYERGEQDRCFDSVRQWLFQDRSPYFDYPIPVNPRGMFGPLKFDADTLACNVITFRRERYLRPDGHIYEAAVVNKTGVIFSSGGILCFGKTVG